MCSFPFILLCIIYDPNLVEKSWTGHTGVVSLFSYLKKIMLQLHVHTYRVVVYYMHAPVLTSKLNLQADMHITPAEPVSPSSKNLGSEPRDSGALD